MPGNPTLTLQTASLYASNDNSTFTGTGGPFGFSPFTSQFGGVVSSAGLAGEPFADTVYGVAPGDIVTFVVAVQNMTAGAGAYGVRLKETMPAGFMVPTDGSGLDLSVTDGAGNVLAVSGDLFGAGLVLTDPIAGYDPDSGLNVTLVTFTLQADQSLPGLYNSLQATASVTADTASPGGPDLSAGVASASTTIVTAAPMPVVTPETDPTGVAKGQTIAFDVTLAVPAGTIQDLRIAPALPAGTAMLDLVSTSFVSAGAGLTLGTPQIASDGSVHFGTVTGSGTGNNVITVRIVVRADGTASGPATLRSVVSAADPSSPGGVWSTTVSSTVGVIAPPAPVLTGLSTNLTATTATTVRPFAALTIADGVPSQPATLAITLQDATLGRLGNAPAGTLDGAGETFVVNGTMAAVLAAAQQLVFTPTTAGAEHFTLTVEDGAGGIAQDASTLVTIASGGTNITVPKVPDDFNGDGRSDVLLQNDNGVIVIWTQANLGITGGILVGNPGPTWHIVAVSDFNGDGQPDLLLQNNNGAIVDYLMGGTAIASGNYLGNAGPAWHVRGAADFNHDGSADVLLQHDNGAMVIWTTNGSSVTGAAYVGNPGAGWTVEGVADFNGDGQPDILLQNSNGALVDYLMNGTSIAAGVYLGNPGPGWAVAGTGDYNADGKADILLHNDAGIDVVWDTNGASVVGAALVGNPGASYTGVVAGLDLNGDGVTDLLIQNTDSSVIGYTINSSTVITAGGYLGAPGAGWHAVGNDPIEFIDGTNGNLNLVATPGPDQFDLTTFAGGLQQITGFDPAQDSVALSAATFTNNAGVQANEYAYQGGTFIALTPGRAVAALVILGITPDHLTAANFVLR